MLAIKTKRMSKLILIGTISAILIGMASCGGGHLCEAYKKADYTKYKVEQSKKIDLNINFNKKNK